MKKILIILAILIHQAYPMSAKIPVEDKTRLSDGWSFLRQDIGNIWESVRPARPEQPETVPLWEAVKKAR